MGSSPFNGNIRKLGKMRAVGGDIDSHEKPRRQTKRFVFLTKLQAETFQF
jgi:hypothetical protein